MIHSLSKTKRETLVACALFSLASCFAADRGPSTPEERQRAVAITHRLEADPLLPENVSDREWALRWLIEVPDIHVSVCGAFLGAVSGSKKNYGPELLVQSTLSSAAFAIEHPEKASDNEAMYLAGLEGALKAYESILKTKGNARSSFLDDLIQKRNANALVDYVRQKMEKCKSGS